MLHCVISLTRHRHPSDLGHYPEREWRALELIKGHRHPTGKLLLVGSDVVDCREENGIGYRPACLFLFEQEVQFQYGMSGSLLK
jgi:hypothetical protein